MGSREPNENEQEENLSKMEDQYILRLPLKLAEQIRTLIDKRENSSGPDRGLSTDNLIEFSVGNDGRGVSFKLGAGHYIGTLVDLPCIIESHKTYDNSNYYKTGDIGQVRHS